MPTKLPTVDKMIGHIRSEELHSIGITEPIVPPIPIHTQSISFAIFGYNSDDTPIRAKRTRQVTLITTIKNKTR